MSNLKLVIKTKLLIKKDKINYTFWDLAGNKNYWKIWKNYIEEANLIIFMVEGKLKDRKSLENDEKAFNIIKEDERIEGKNVLLLVNKNVKKFYYHVLGP